MAEMNGQFSDDGAVEILGDDNLDFKNSGSNEKIAALEQENRELVHEKEAIEKKIGELKQSLEGVGNEKEKLLKELQESKAEIKTLASVAARASQLEGDVSSLQHDLISATSELSEVNGELSALKSTFDGFKKREGDREKEFEAVVAERDLLIEKLGKMEAKENQYLSEIDEKEKEIGSLRVQWRELKAAVGKSGDDKKNDDNLKRALEARVAELERKLKDKDTVINGFEEKVRGTTVVEGKSCGPMTGEINLGWQVVAGSALGLGLAGLVFYVHQARRT